MDKFTETENGSFPERDGMMVDQGVIAEWVQQLIQKMKEVMVMITGNDYTTLRKYLMPMKTK